MKIGIEHMVCARCIDAVKDILVDTGLPANYVELGVVELSSKLSENKRDELREKLNNRGFELIFDRETELVNLIKSTLINYLAHLENEDHPQKLSLFVTSHTNYNYSYLSKIFSDQKKKTIERFLIELKIERVKELLNFKKYTLSEVAWKLKYSSVQYLSNQFKKITGETVTSYLKHQKQSRKRIDQI